jgi:hypothetical protein
MTKEEKEMKNEKGFVALLLVLIVGVVGIAIATSVVLVGVNSSRNGFLLVQSDEALAIAEACAEKGLEAIRENSMVSGTFSLNLGRGSCSYSVSILSGESRRVEAFGAVGNVRRKIRVEVDALKPRINISSWREVI